MSLLYTYSLIRTFYNADGGDYIDSFIPLVIASFADASKKYKYSEVKKQVFDKFELVIPEYSVDAILNRAHKKGYVQRAERTVRLTEDGLKLHESFSANRDVQRQLNELVLDTLAFVNSSGIVINEAPSLF